MQETSNATAVPSRRRSMYVPKVDLYGPIHKALFWALSRALGNVGRASPSNAAEVGAVLAEVEQALWLVEGHIAHEDRFIHPAIEERRPGATQKLVREHADHANAMHGIRVLLGAIRSGSPETRPALFRALYLRFAEMTAETIDHMREEEEIMQPLLEELYAPAELHAIHDRLVASIPPDDMLVYLRVMLPANDVDFRVGMLSAAMAAMPAAAFAGMFAAATVHLAEEEIGALADRLAPGDAQ